MTPVKFAPLLMVLALAAPLLVTPAYAGADDRIRTIDFDDQAVVRLDTCIGFQTMITFADNEKVENIALGDAAQWQATPNKRGNVMFIKPFTKSAYSNMTVVTNRRRYSFELSARDTVACKRGDVTYDLRFRYAEPPPAPAASPVVISPAGKPEVKSLLPEKRNTDYSYSGISQLVPLRVFDDGRSTYMRWSDGIVIPAIYALNADATESLVNFAYIEGYIVIEQISPGFVLRRGEDKTVIHNEGYAYPSLDTESPRARPEAPKKKFSLFGSKQK